MLTLGEAAVHEAVVLDLMKLRPLVVYLRFYGVEIMHTQTSVVIPLKLLSIIRAKFILHLLSLGVAFIVVITLGDLLLRYLVAVAVLGVIGDLVSGEIVLAEEVLSVVLGLVGSIRNHHPLVEHVGTLLKVLVKIIVLLVVQLFFL